ncbi:ABC transporter ATP-binding protein [Gimesia sp.]|uniref:ABC transporter ATP-binding protein n=1 Tax=Gimesia sp. TaxID=2024833 RepID=UPI003A949AC8
MYSDAGAKQAVAISLESVSKSFQIYEKPHHRLMQGLFRGKKQFYREFKAVSNISFEIPQGETVGIIGRNGAGKSTLLQMICGTMTPTSGTVQINGRVAALLELGSGFNPEFTGRENVYMNGAILGLTRDEVENRFDDIIAFAEIGDFIDQPVKTYSSGMYVRLAFAVIAHVDADILIIDEALSVGDALFTQKCMRFIRSFKEQGTLLFVSHDMGSVLSLCEKAVWLEKGIVKSSGEAKQVSEEYLQYTLQETYHDEASLVSTKPERQQKQESPQAQNSVSTKKKISSVAAYESECKVTSNISNSSGWKTGEAEIVAVTLEDLNSDSEGALFKGGEQVKLSIYAKTYKDLENPILGFVVKDRLGQDLFGENTLPETNQNPISFRAGETLLGEFTFMLPMLPNGEYAVMASIADGNLYENIQHHYLHDALLINVSSSTIRWGLVGIAFENISLRKD